eukprot:6269148-Pyramimonas_sp.AAC.1
MRARSDRRRAHVAARLLRNLRVFRTNFLGRFRRSAAAPWARSGRVFGSCAPPPVEKKNQTSVRLGRNLRGLAAWPLGLSSACVSLATSP